MVLYKWRRTCRLTLYIKRRGCSFLSLRVLGGFVWFRSEWPNCPPESTPRRTWAGCLKPPWSSTEHTLILSVLVRTWHTLNTLCSSVFECKTCQMWTDLRSVLCWAAVLLTATRCCCFSSCSDSPVTPHISAILSMIANWFYIYVQI